MQLPRSSVLYSQWNLSLNLSRGAIKDTDDGVIGQSKLEDIT